MTSRSAGSSQYSSSIYKVQQRRTEAWKKKALFYEKDIQKLKTQALQHVRVIKEKDMQITSLKELADDNAPLYEELCYSLPEPKASTDEFQVNRSRISIPSLSLKEDVIVESYEGSYYSVISSSSGNGTAAPQVYIQRNQRSNWRFSYAIRGFATFAKRNQNYFILLLINILSQSNGLTIFNGVLHQGYDEEE